MRLSQFIVIRNGRGRLLSEDCKYVDALWVVEECMLIAFSEFRVCVMQLATNDYRYVNDLNRHHCHHVNDL